MSLAESLAIISSTGPEVGLQHESFPARRRTSSGPVNGTQTDVSSHYFSDKILVTVSQGGRLSQWIHVPLSSASPTSYDTALPALGDDNLLPQGHLSPKTLVGGGGDERESVGHLYATQIANSISLRDPEERRTILVGIGLLKVDSAREAFFDMVELLQKVL